MRVALALTLLAVLAPGAAASMRQESIFEDGAVLLQSGPERQAAGLDEMAALGADTVRVLVTWRDVAGRRNRYREAGFARYDTLVQGAVDRGMQVLLTPVGPTPKWASGCRRQSPKLRGCRPSPRLYGAFLRVLGRRYPQVDRWSFWNEPNQAGWLSPQFARHGGRVVNVAAVRYRALARAGIAALRATGHGRDTLLLGETAPVGRTSGPLAVRNADPTTFIRTLLCEGRYRHGAGCAGERRLEVSGFAHHPYTMGAHEPPDGRSSPGQLSFTDGRRLQRLLDRSRLVRRRLPVWYTEFGYQTNPPDPRLGVLPARAAAYLNQADAVAAADPRIRSVSQYKLVDDPELPGFQTGLRRYGTLRRKETYAAYRLPIWPVRRGRSVSVYGQLRPAPDGPAVAVIEHARSPRGPWRSVRALTVRTRTHQFRVRVPYRRGVYRLAYGTLHSRAATP